jgi:branched-chain amino acid transport system substrate-binding protein
MHASAVAGMTALAVEHGVVAALGQWHLRTTPGAAETAERFGVPMFVENGHNTVTAEGRRTIFRTYFTIAERTALMFDFLAEQGLRRIGLIASDTVFAASTAHTIEEEAAHRGGFSVLRFDFEQETTVDVRAELRRIAEFEPDIVINAGVIRTNYLVVNQAAEVGLRPDVPMMVTFAFPMRSADFWAAAGEHGNGIIWPATYYSPSWEGLTPIGRWFTDRYIARYGSVPPDTSLSAFTDVTILGQALDLVGSDARDDLVRGLESGEFETWRGLVRFGRDATHWHHTPPELRLLQYQSVGQGFDDAAVVYPATVRTGDYLAPAALCAGTAGR